MFMLIEAMARSLSLTPRLIAKLATAASHRYKHFTVKKAGGGERDIYHPAKDLKGVQRWLQSAVVNQFPVHEAAAAYRRRKSSSGLPRSNEICSRAASFTSLPDLARKIRRYITRYNEDPKPIRWTYSNPAHRITTDSADTVHYGAYDWQDYANDRNTHMTSHRFYCRTMGPIGRALVTLHANASLRRFQRRTSRGDLSSRNATNAA
jgi:hypothetical protein